MRKPRTGSAFHEITDILIRDETPADYDAVREVNRLAFGRDDEASLVDALRDGRFARLSFVAELHGSVVGHILFSDLPILTGPDSVPALALAPLAVLPEYQRRGIGSQLTSEALDRCRERNHLIVVVLGHPDFYDRFGFSSELANRLESPFSGNPAFMALELVKNALNGVVGRVEYPPPFGISDR